MSTSPTSTADHLSSYEINKLLAKEKKIAIVWSYDDVQSVRTDLTDDEAFEVLQEAERKHDAEHGISWLTLGAVADELFPKA